MYLLRFDFHALADLKTHQSITAIGPMSATSHVTSPGYCGASIFRRRDSAPSRPQIFGWIRLKMGDENKEKNTESRSKRQEDLFHCICKHT